MYSVIISEINTGAKWNLPPMLALTYYSLFWLLIYRETNFFLFLILLDILTTLPTLKHVIWDTWVPLSVIISNSNQMKILMIIFYSVNSQSNPSVALDCERHFSFHLHILHQISLLHLIMNSLHLKCEDYEEIKLWKSHEDQVQNDSHFYSHFLISSGNSVLQLGFMEFSPSVSNHSAFETICGKREWFLL